MPQDQRSGARANQWGRTTARQIMQRLGTVPLNPNSNECMWRGKRVAVKCARMATSEVGISYLMAERLESVLGAFETSSGSFGLYELPIKTFRRNMAPTRSLGPAHGRVGMVRKKVFLEQGQCQGEVTVDGIEPQVSP